MTLVRMTLESGGKKKFAKALYNTEEEAKDDIYKTIQKINLTISRKCGWADMTTVEKDNEITATFTPVLAIYKSSKYTFKITK